MYRPSWLIITLPIYRFINMTFVMKIVFQSWYITSKKSSRFRNAYRASDWWYPAHLLISDSVSKETTRRKVWEAPTRRSDIRMTSNKVCDDSQRRRGDAVIQNDQWKSDKLLTLVITACWANSVLSFDFRYENDVRPWMFEQRRVWRISVFFTGVIHHPPHASSRRELHPLFFWSYFPI